MAKPIKVVVLGDAKDARKAFQQISAEAKETQGSLSETFGKMGDSIKGSIGPAALAAGVAGGAALVAGLFVKGFMDGIEAEGLTDRLMAQLNLTEDEAAVSGEIASAVYREAWGENLGQVNDAIKNVVQILDQDLSGASKDVTQGLVEDALTVADVWDKDVNEVVRAAGALLDSDLADSAEHAFDIITTGLTEGADLNGDFLDSLFEYSTFFGQAGLSAEQMLNGLIAGTDAGMMGVDKVGDAVKEMSIRIQDGSDASIDALNGIGLNAEIVMNNFAAGGEAAKAAASDVITALADVEDPLSQTQYAIALLGTPFEDLGVVGPEVLEALADGTIDVRDTADVAADAYSNVATELESLKRKGSGALQDFVGAALGVLLGGDGTLEGGLVTVNDWIDENQENIIAWGEDFGEAAVQVYEDLGPLLALLGDVASWFVDNADDIASWGGDFAYWVQIATAQLGPLMSVLGGIQDAIEWISNKTRNSSDLGKGFGGGGGGGSTWGTGGPLPVMHNGGVVAGPVGSDQLIVAQAGEYVVPIGGSAPGGVNVVVNVAGSVMSERDLVEAVRQGIIRTERRNGKGAFV